MTFILISVYLHKGFFLYWHQTYWLKLFYNCFELETQCTILVTWFSIVNEGKKNHILPYLMCRLWKLQLTCFMYNECCWCKCCFSLMSISRRLEHYKSSEVFEIDVSLKLFPLNPRVCVDLQNKFPSVLIET